MFVNVSPFDCALFASAMMSAIPDSMVISVTASVSPIAPLTIVSSAALPFFSDSRLVSYMIAPKIIGAAAGTNSARPICLPPIFTALFCLPAVLSNAASLSPSLDPASITPPWASNAPITNPAVPVKPLLRSSMKSAGLITPLYRSGISAATLANSSGL